MKSRLYIQVSTHFFSARFVFIFYFYFSIYYVVCFDIALNLSSATDRSVGHLFVRYDICGVCCVLFYGFLPYYCHTP